MINKTSLVLVFCFVITSCTMDCIEPGLQSRNTSFNVDVPVKEANDGAKIHWVDSGQVISDVDKSIKFTIDGSINFCHSQKDKNPRNVLVPSSFCSNGSVPNYDKAKDVSRIPDNYGINEGELCSVQGFGSNRRYVDTGIKVDPGDKLSFSLVPREMIIDYDNLQGKSISFDDNCYKTQEGDKKATIKDMLNGGTFFCGDNGKRTELKFPQLSKENIEKGKVLVGNGYTPYDNKVHFNKDHINKSWMYGSLLDLRRAKIGLNELCDGKNCDLNEIKKYSSYELNCYYQNICYTEKGIWNYGLGRAEERNCVSSIRYSKYDKGNECDMYSHIKKIEDKLKKIEENKRDPRQIKVDFTLDTEKDISWAEALVAKIAPSINYENTPYNDRSDIRSDAKGSQCLPKDGGANGNKVCSQISNNFEDFSLKLSHDYKINEAVTPGSTVMLAIADYGHHEANRGGYHVQISRSCEFADGEKLYFYLGDKPPTDLSTADANDFNSVLKLNKKTEDAVNYYIIDGSHLNTGETKKIYFGIDVSNVEKDEITDKDGKSYEDNKYSVNLFVKNKINDFISSTINQIFDFIMEGGDETIKNSYEGYRKGLLQGVRALLTLYVIFTVVGYMLGTVQLSKFDFVVRITKIAFIAFAFSDKSFEFFGTNLSKLFVGGSIYLVDSFSGYIDAGGKKFAFLDLTAGVLFTGETWLKFLSLMLAGPFGFIAFLLILKASFTFLECIIGAIVKYVITTVLVAFLLSLTPLFIVFMLFQQTKPLFDNWIKTLAQISLQPVILFSSLSLLNQLMYSVLYNLTNFSACYQCLISVNFLSYDLCLMKSMLPLGYSASTGVDVALNSGRSGGNFAALPIDLVQAFIYLIIASAMEAFVSISEAMAQALFGVSYGIAGNIGHVARSASQAVLSTVGLDNNTQNMIQRIKEASYKDPTKTEIKDKPRSNDQTPGQSGGQGSSSEKAKKED